MDLHRALSLIFSLLDRSTTNLLISGKSARNFVFVHSFSGLRIVRETIPQRGIVRDTVPQRGIVRDTVPQRGTWIKVWHRNGPVSYEMNLNIGD